MWSAEGSCCHMALSPGAADNVLLSKPSLSEIACCPLLCATGRESGFEMVLACISMSATLCAGAEPVANNRPRPSPIQRDIHSRLRGQRPARVRSYGRDAGMMRLQRPRRERSTTAHFAAT